MLVRPVPNSTGAGAAVSDMSVLAQIRRMVESSAIGGDGALVPVSVRQLAVGGQARLYLADTACDQRVVVKAFDPSMPQVADAFADACASLEIAHRALDGKRFGGWTIRIPRVLHRSPRDLAFVMTYAPGQSVFSLLDGDEWDAGQTTEIAVAIASAMQHFWSVAARPYGDMNLHNVLRDQASRALWMVDCGIPASRWRCDDVSARWAPASRDLGYLLYFGASSVRATLGKPRVRRRQKEVGEQIVRHCAALIACGEIDSFLNEVHACARVHLGALQASFSPGGIWRWIVRREAARSLGRSRRELSRILIENCTAADEPMAAAAVAASAEVTL